MTTPYDNPSGYPPAGAPAGSRMAPGRRPGGGSPGGYPGGYPGGGSPGGYPGGGYPTRYPAAGASPYGVEPLPPVEYATWWERFAAYLIDAVIVSIGLSVIYVGMYLVGLALSNQSSLDFAVALQLFGDLVAIAFIFWYYPGQWAERGQTFGQQALHIMVVREDGELIGFGGGLLRFFVGMGILDNIVFGLPIGWLWAMWDRKNQAWHDKVAGTVVVRV